MIAAPLIPESGLVCKGYHGQMRPIRVAMQLGEEITVQSASNPLDISWFNRTEITWLFGSQGIQTHSLVPIMLSVYKSLNRCKLVFKEFTVGPS